MGKKSRQMLSHGNYEIIEREDFDTEQETYLIEPMPAPKLDATRDLDLGKVRWEDEVICKLMMWIYKTEREKQIKKPKSLKLKYRFTDKIAHRTKYYLLPHADPRHEESIAISGPDLNIWGIGDGRLAVGISQDGPFALLPNGMRVFRVPGYCNEMLYMFKL